MQFDKLVSALIGVHAFTVLGPQVLVLQKMLAAVWPKGMLHVLTTSDVAMQSFPDFLQALLHQSESKHKV